MNQKGDTAKSRVTLHFYPKSAKFKCADNNAVK